MTVRVILISPAMNGALREARFEGDGPLDAAGARQARTAAGTLPPAAHCVSAPSLRCRETAEALGLRAAEPEPALADWDMGRWRGRRLSEVGESEPEAVAAWLTDPSAAPHGGESLTGLCDRVGGWLESLADGTEGLLAVTEPAVIRAAMVRALALPVETFWRLDVAPLTLTELTGRSGRWNLRCGRPLGRAGGE
jgi:broad specificity phosphatase PhoE